MFALTYIALACALCNILCTWNQQNTSLVRTVYTVRYTAVSLRHTLSGVTANLALFDQSLLLLILHERTYIIGLAKYTVVWTSVLYFLHRGKVPAGPAHRLRLYFQSGTEAMCGAGAILKVGRKPEFRLLPEVWQPWNTKRNLEVYYGSCYGIIQAAIL